jgi:hypothetical protein
MEQPGCSEMLAYKIQMPGSPEEGIKHSEHSDSLKSRITPSLFLSWFLLSLSNPPNFLAEGLLIEHLACHCHKWTADAPHVSHSSRP